MKNLSKIFNKNTEKNSKLSFHPIKSLEIKESIFVSSKNKFEVLFIKEGPYWKGTTLQFSGVNSLGFYHLVQKKLIDWTVFSSGI